MIPDFGVLTGQAWSQLWQVSVLILAVGLATRLFCRTRPHLAYVLWLLVIVKCLTPPVWSSPTGIFSWATARHTTTEVVEVQQTDTIIDATSDNTLIDTHKSESFADIAADVGGLVLCQVIILG